MATTTKIEIATMPAGGRLLRAVPYSSPILNSACGPVDGSGFGGGGVGDGLDMATSIRRDCTRKGRIEGLLRPIMLHCLSKVLHWQSIQNIPRRQPCPPRLQYPEADFLHVGRVVGVGVDRDLYSKLLGQPEMPVAKIEPVGIRVQFHGDLVPSRGLQHRVQVESVGLAAQ